MSVEEKNSIAQSNNNNDNNNQAVAAAAATTTTVTTIVTTTTTTTTETRESTTNNNNNNSTGNNDNNSNNNNNNSKKNRRENKDINYKHQKEDFELGRILGGGSYAQVVEGKVINPKSPFYNQEFAVKIMDKKNIMKNDKVKYVNIEKKVFLLTHTHPFVCHMHFAFQDDYSLYLVLDLCTEGELSYLIWKYFKLTEELTKIYMAELISALEMMHTNGIYHRDLKPENVLIHKDGHIRLTDFGTARIIDPTDEKEKEILQKQEQGSNEDPQLIKERKGSFVGTALYVPPEMLADKPFSFAGMDFWAIGCMIYQCLTGKPPFSGANEYLIFKAIESHEYEVPDFLSPNAVDIIAKLLNPNFKERLGMKGFEEIKQHPFFAGIEWDWEHMQNFKVPSLPKTPINSPALSSAREERSESGWEDMSDLKEAKVVSTSSESPQPLPEKTSLSQENPNQTLFSKWKKLLMADEIIDFGSQIEISKMWGFSTESCVMLLTNKSRFVVIDHSKMKIKYEIPLSTVIQVVVVDKQVFSLETPKKTYKMKATGVSSQQWYDMVRPRIKK